MTKTEKVTKAPAKQACGRAPDKRRSGLAGMTNDEMKCYIKQHGTESQRIEAHTRARRVVLCDIMREIQNKSTRNKSTRNKSTRNKSIQTKSINNNKTSSKNIQGFTFQ
jgi:hypothetical protein